MIKKLPPLGFFLLVPGLLWADVKTMTLSDCIALGMQNNQDLKIAKQEIRKAAGEQKRVRALLLPQLKLSGTYMAHHVTYNDALISDYQALRNLPGGLGQLFLSALPPSLRPSFSQQLQEILGDFTLPENLPGKIGMLNASLQIQQPLFTGFKLLNAYRASAEARKAAEYNLKVKQSEIEYDITRTFYRALFLDSLVSVHQMSVDIGEKHLHLIENMRREGLASEWELLKAKVHIKKLRPDLIEAKRNRNLIYSKLKLLIGMSQTDTLYLSGRLEPVTAAPTFAPDELYDTALKNRGEVRALSSLIQASEHATGVARGGNLPNVAVFGSYTALGLKDNYRIGTKDLNHLFTLGIGLKWDIFNFGIRSGKVQKAQAQTGQLQETRARLCEAIKIQIQQAVSAMNYAREELQSERNAVELAQKALRIAQEAFRNGDARQVDVLDAQLDLHSARVEWLDAVFKTITADLDYKKALGVMNSLQR